MTWNCFIFWPKVPSLIQYLVNLSGFWGFLFPSPLKKQSGIQGLYIPIKNIHIYIFQNYLVVVLRRVFLEFEVKPFNQNKKQVMDGFCPVSCSGWSTPHALTDPTYLSCATGGKSDYFSPPQKHLKPQEWLENQISFNYKKKPNPSMSMKHLSWNAQTQVKLEMKSLNLKWCLPSELFFFLRQHRRKKKKSTFSDGVK